MFIFFLGAPSLCCAKVVFVCDGPAEQLSWVWSAGIQEVGLLFNPGALWWMETLNNSVSCDLDLELLTSTCPRCVCPPLSEWFPTLSSTLQIVQWEIHYSEVSVFFLLNIQNVEIVRMWEQKLQSITAEMQSGPSQERNLMLLWNMILAHLNLRESFHRQFRMLMH